MDNKSIKKLTIKNFKKIRSQTFEFRIFDLLVGQNNSGKSTILQAMAIWQYCVEEFKRKPIPKGRRNPLKRDTEGVQIVLPNFTALPLPEFNLLWNDKTDRRYSPNGNSNEKRQEYILVEIELEWRDHVGHEKIFGVQLRYQAPQSAYAIPKQGWQTFWNLLDEKVLPRIAYVPPFSGLEPLEEWGDEGKIRKQVGKAQPGSVLRNLLYRVVDRYKETGPDGKPTILPIKDNDDWTEVTRVIKNWFGVVLNAPVYEKGGNNTEISLTYKAQNGREFDIISAGSGFHQVLTLLAFYYGYEGLTTVLFDEPDAHMHVNLQREVISYFQQKTDVQFIVATHAEEFIKGVEAQSIISVLQDSNQRISSTAAILTALSEIDNMTLVATTGSPFILYLEGEDDYRLLSAWAEVLDKSTVMKKFHPFYLAGGSKKEMKERAEAHFKGLRQLVPKVERMQLFDYDSDENAFHPADDNAHLFEWKRRNVENYLLVTEAWERAALKGSRPDLFNSPISKAVQEFFENENLTLPRNATWKNVQANIFKSVDGKKILFYQEDALFHSLKAKFGLHIDRSTVARNMSKDEIHQDIEHFFAKLEQLALSV